LAVVLAACSPAADERAAAPAATALELTGDLSTHDPALVVGKGSEPWYVFSTGDGRVGLGSPQIRRSSDGQEWEHVGQVWGANNEPTWARDHVPDVDNYWAPEVYEHDGVYYLYYSASTFGSNTSLIGLYTNTTLDPDDPDYAWVDRGQVMFSDGTVDFNAIDPGVVEDADGTPWMAFGSFWGGIFMVQLEWPSGLRADPDAEPIHLVDRRIEPNAVEAPYIYPHDGWYYLFHSRDSCCQGTASTYNIAVGRSRAVTGPYVDADGVPLLEGGGTVVLETEGHMIGPGGQSVSDDHLAFHYYDEDLGGEFQLAIRKLAWDEGWPVAQPSSEPN
jgi:arabinan endo-1,5-alpha-L-arabinosidase